MGVHRSHEQRFQKVQSPLHSDTLDSEGSYKQEVLTDWVAASLGSVGCACTEIFPTTSLLVLLIWMRVRGYKGIKKKPKTNPTNSRI